MMMQQQQQRKRTPFHQSSQSSHVFACVRQRSVSTYHTYRLTYEHYNIIICILTTTYKYRTSTRYFTSSLPYRRQQMGRTAYGRWCGGYLFWIPRLRTSKSFSLFACCSASRVATHPTFSCTTGKRNILIIEYIQRK
jgi:hypothetical protein